MRFRFLVDERGPGTLNMAVDEALFLSAGEHRGHRNGSDLRISSAGSERGLPAGRRGSGRPGSLPGARDRLRPKADRGPSASPPPGAHVQRRLSARRRFPGPGCSSGLRCRQRRHPARAFRSSRPARSRGARSEPPRAGAPRPLPRTPRPPRDRLRGSESRRERPEARVGAHFSSTGLS